MYGCQNLGLDWDERVLPSIGNEIIKAVVAQYNAEQLLTQRDKVSKAVGSALAWLRVVQAFCSFVPDTASWFALLRLMSELCCIWCVVPTGEREPHGQSKGVQHPC